jgi:hypothetical protein
MRNRLTCSLLRLLGKKRWPRFSTMGAKLTGGFDVGRWNLRYEWIGEGLSPKEVLA